VTPGLRIGALALTLCLGGSGVAMAQKTDVVVLANGDRVTCEISSLSSGLLTVKTDDMGTIRIEWDKVRSVTSSSTFEVETSGGALWYGSLAAGAPGRIVVAGATPTTLDQMTVFRISTLEKGFWHRLEGSINMGGSVTKSSGVGQVYANVDVGARRPSYSWKIVFDSTTTFREDEPDSGRYMSSLTYTRNLRDRWIFVAYSQVESNRDLGFDLRAGVGAGGGRNLIQSTRRLFQAIGGLSTNREDPIEAGAVTNVEAVAIAKYSAVSYDYPKSETTVTLTILPSVSDPGRIRAGANLKMSRAFFTNDFVFAITAFDDYDNRPPAGALNTNDVGLSFSLGWKF
jgi:hypothetical protein